MPSSPYNQACQATNVSVELLIAITAAHQAALGVVGDGSGMLIR
jgi:hypothetical protein